jgi:predicted nuclease with TOPRIM domain
MSDRELAAKFRENCRGRIPAGQIESAIDLVLGHLVEIDDVSIVGLLGAGPPPP